MTPMTKARMGTPNWNCVRFGRRRVAHNVRIHEYRGPSDAHGGVVLQSNRRHEPSSDHAGLHGADALRAEVDAGDGSTDGTDESRPMEFSAVLLEFVLGVVEFVGHKGEGLLYWAKKEGTLYDDEHVSADSRTYTKREDGNHDALKACPEDVEPLLGFDLLHTIDDAKLDRDEKGDDANKNRSDDKLGALLSFCRSLGSLGRSQSGDCDPAL